MPCFYCQRSLKRRPRTREHVLPVSRGGTDDPFNVVECCHECNELVGDWPVTTKLAYRELVRVVGFDSLPKLSSSGRVDRAAVHAMLPDVDPDELPYEWRSHVRFKDVVIDASRYRAATGTVPRKHSRGQWVFEADGRRWRSTVTLFSKAAKRMRQTCVERRVVRAEVLPPEDYDRPAWPEELRSSNGAARESAEQEAHP